MHTWYLSLIGQFYIVFPLVVLVINKLLGQKYLKAAIFALTIFTFVYAEQKFILSKDDNLYYLSAMRAWELLFGASLAFIKIEWYVENGDTRTLANLQVLQSKLNHPRQ